MHNPHIRFGVWFWRVDTNFIARAARLVAKSKAERTPIDPDELERIRELWRVVEERTPGLWASLPNNQYPGRLAGLETLTEVHEFMRFGLIPKTADWKPRDEDDAGPVSSPVEVKPRPTSKPKRETIPGMF